MLVNGYEFMIVVHLPTHLKHYLPLNAELIPYGWGHSGDESADRREAIVFEETAELARSRGGAGASRESGGGGGVVSPDSSGGARSASAAVTHVVRPASAPSDGGDYEGGEKDDVMPMNAMTLAAAVEKGKKWSPERRAAMG